MHLRMTGTLLLDPEGDPPHNRVWFELGDHRLAFTDPRRFGTGELALGEDALEAFLAARLGVEPLDGSFTGEHLYALARTSRAPIKAFLLDQKRVAGVGNIYADEALFRARIHPLRPANRLTRAQSNALRDAVVASLEAGIEAERAPRSTTSAIPTASAGPSRTASRSTCARASRATTAATRCASCAPRAAAPTSASAASPALGGGFAEVGEPA